MIRVLIVDDSVVARRALSEALAGDPEVSVVGSAATGSIALQKLELLAPQVVLLDLEMPDMDGIETIRRLREGWPELPVIMCSALTARGAEVTLRALAAGATDYVTKPSAASVALAGLGPFKRELLAKVKALAEPKAPFADFPSTIRDSHAAAKSLPKEFSVLAIGGSTGGPNALATLFARMPKDLMVPIFIVQHMPPLFTTVLAERLSSASGVSVVEAQHGTLVEPGHAYLAPGDYHLTVGRDGARAVTRLNQGPAEHSCRPAVDVLFRSLADFYGAGVLGCVLTGMGCDGARGARNIVAAGGTVLVQSAETCVVPGMPRAVEEAGLAEMALPLDRLADELALRVGRSRGLSPASGALTRRKA
jgi:two-component system, chemotaxis family, protein-glutamate methylesterase/glutaminase